MLVSIATSLEGISYVLKEIYHESEYGDKDAPVIWLCAIAIDGLIPQLEKCHDALDFAGIDLEALCESRD